MNDSEKMIGSSDVAGGRSTPEASGVPTPAGYHRGQNPNPIQVQGLQIPIEILMRIEEVDKAGVVAWDEVGLDHVTLTGKGSQYEAAIEVFESDGFSIESNDGGLRHYRSKVLVQGGGVVAWNHRNGVDSWMLELPGAMWMADHPKLFETMRKIVSSLNVKATRVDIRRDQYGRDLTLIDDVFQACHSGTLCRARDFEDMARRFAKSPERFKGRGLYLGSRKSDRFVRIYDKGLERGWPSEGVWIRVEAQLRHDAAAEAVAALIDAGDSWTGPAFDRLIGVVDFRVPTERHATIEERQRLDWWEQFCSGRAGVRSAASREPADAHAYLRWVLRAVLPTIEGVRQGLGLDHLSDVFRLLDRTFSDVKPGGSMPTVRHLVALLAENHGNYRIAID